MSRACYDPIHSIEVWERMIKYTKGMGYQGPEYLSTHPPEEKRLKHLQKVVPIARREYEKNHCPLKKFDDSKPTRSIPIL